MFNSNLGRILHRFGDTAAYRSKNRPLEPTPLSQIALAGVTPCEFFDKSYLARSLHHGAIMWWRNHDASPRAGKNVGLFLYHKIFVIFRLFAEMRPPPVDGRICMKFGIGSRLADLVICAKFCGDRFRGFDSEGSNSDYLHWLTLSPLKIQRCRAACEVILWR